MSEEFNMKKENQNQKCKCGHLRKVHRVLRCPLCGYTKMDNGNFNCKCGAGMVRFNEDLYCHGKGCLCKKFIPQNHNNSSQVNKNTPKTFTSEDTQNYLCPSGYEDELKKFNMKKENQNYEEELIKSVLENRKYYKNSREEDIKLILQKAKEEHLKMIDECKKKNFSKVSQDFCMGYLQGLEEFKKKLEKKNGQN